MGSEEREAGLLTFTVFRRGEFWMYARGKTAKQLRHLIWWRRRGEVPKEEITVEPTPAKADGKPLFIHRRKLQL